ncbi:MAG: 2TM domain-containing protein [Flavobacteriaceae bacterium]
MKSDIKLINAEKKVKRIRNFYNHLQIFVIVMIVLLLFSNTIIVFFENHITNPNWLKWVRANIWVNALLWFFGLLIHAAFTFRYKLNFIEKWENEKVREIMNEKE